MLKPYQQKTTPKSALKAESQLKGLSKALLVTIILAVLLIIGTFFTAKYLYNHYFGDYHRKAVEYYDKAVDYKQGFEEAVGEVEDVVETGKKWLKR